ncbi:hypothetical protein ATI61_11950 [Archangium gephyra]|uniref:Lipoprotein n=1 Tax=Archangium gephyra TaxID=48 RepID=A0AAC8QA53_9BACT|nr:hypothetical protein [Archangium gephyra]AKJ03699.1 Hypothetical protein AA314_05325 [Archangium gephyra]REG22520.1 hypothetical protein ATI61_11950 [Archangium gephyra]
MNKLLPLLLPLLCACETVVTPPAEAFQILDVTPREQVTNESKSITVQLDVEPRFHVNYGEQEVRMIDEPVLELGPQVVPLDTYLGHGQFQGRVGPGLQVGRYAVRVKMGDGREATLPDAYEVKPSVGFWIESIGDQYVNEPFTITLHAAGPDADGFEGMVRVSLYKGGASTHTYQSNPFSAGICQQEITIDTPGNNYLIVVEDDQNNSATSNAFRVISKN